LGTLCFRAVPNARGRATGGFRRGVRVGGTSAFQNQVIKCSEPWDPRSLGSAPPVLLGSPVNTIRSFRAEKIKRLDLFQGRGRRGVELPRPTLSGRRAPETPRRALALLCNQSKLVWFAAAKPRLVAFDRYIFGATRGRSRRSSPGRFGARSTPRRFGRRRSDGN